MNNTFNIQRLCLLLKRQWLEFGRIYLITLAVALGVIITFYGFSLYPVLIKARGIGSNDLGFRAPLFLILGFLFITVVASSYFAHLGQKPKAIIDLMIPASTFEKFITSVFFTALLSTVSFVIIFYLTDFAFISKLRNMFPDFKSEESRNGITVSIDHLAYFFNRNNPREFTSIYLITPFFVTSIFLLGSIYFNRYHYIKTTICTMIFSGIWTWIMVKTGQAIFEGKILKNDGGFINIGNSKWQIELVVFSLFLLLTTIFWIITYTRLKEKQV